MASKPVKSGEKRPNASNTALTDKKRRVQRKWTDRECEDVLNYLKETILMNGQIEVRQLHNKIMIQLQKQTSLLI
jgi:hypothetical protein